MQTRLQSLFEAFINIFVGYWIAVLANYVVIPWFGYNVTVGDSMGIGLILTVISIARSYALRRFFNWYHSVRL